jgi:hypothetical protein
MLLQEVHTDMLKANELGILIKGIKRALYSCEQEEAPIAMGRHAFCES